LVMPPLTILASVLIGHFYFGEKLFWIQNIGASLILIGIILVILGPIFLK
jgi:drug/metabolite transporter (DMT)-like permease